MANRLHLKRDDTVVVIAGKDRGKRGKIVHAFPGNGKVLVQGLNLAIRHMRPTQKVQQGGRQQKEVPIDASNVMLICPSCGEPTKVRRRVLDDGRRVRCCKKCDEEIDS